jgi:hypothetical protein
MIQRTCASIRAFTRRSAICTGPATVAWSTGKSQIYVVGAGITLPTGARVEGRISTSSQHEYIYRFPPGHCFEADLLGKGKGYAFELVGPDDNGAICEALSQGTGAPCEGNALDTGEPPEWLGPGEDQLPL